MSNRRSVALGLASGAIVAALLLGGLVAFLPGRAAGSMPPASPSAAPSGGPSADASSEPSPSAVAGESPGPIVAAFHIGEPAPRLLVPQVGGGTIDLAALDGTPLWINFMGTYCPPCVDEFPLMNGFAARYASAGLVVVAIDVREEEGVVAAFAESLNATFPLGLDRDGAAQREWEAFALPMHFWIDTEGIIRDGALGGVGPDIMARGVSRILPGVEVTP